MVLIIIPNSTTMTFWNLCNFSNVPFSIMTETQFDMWMEEGLRQTREDASPTSDTLYAEEKKLKDIDVLALESLLTDCGATSVSHLRSVLPQ